MKLRTRLILAFLVFAAVPMVIVTYSYRSSIAALKQAALEESKIAADELNQRMAKVRERLDTVLGRASSVRLAPLIAADGSIAPDSKLLAEFHQELDQVAPMLDSCEFVPRRPDFDHEPVHPEPVPDHLPEPESHSPQPEPAEHQPPSMQVIELGEEVSISRTSGTDDESVVYVFKGSLGEDETSITFSIASQTDPVKQVVKTISEAISSSKSTFTSELVMIGKELEKEALAAIEAEDEQLAEQIIERKAQLVERQELLARSLEKYMPMKMRMDERRTAHARELRKRAEALLGRSFDYPVLQDNQIVGHLRARVKAEDMVWKVLEDAWHAKGDIPFAIDKEGNLHTVKESDREILNKIPGVSGNSSEEQAPGDDWIVVKSEDPDSGMEFGIARPVGESLREVRRTAFHNLVWGLLLVGFAGFGILPLSRHLTRNLHRISEAAKALAAGDLSVRVPIKSKDELGQLASTFNHMAAELDQHQDQLLEHERLRQEQELQNRLLEVENRRKSRELEDARLLQLSLLPSHLPEHPDLDIAVSMRTATEVGGDFYDFRTASDSSLSAAIGDATGHGAAAGTMVTMAKSLFTACPTEHPASFLRDAGSTIRQMRPERMCMAMMLANISNRQLVVSAAGMPPMLLHHRHDGRIEEVLIPGVPLGALRNPTYSQRSLSLEAGDTVLFMSDGFPELVNDCGEPLGYDRAMDHFAAVVDASPAEIITALEAFADRWRGDRPQGDDITFVVLRVK
jgi:serine phosphatase RsbU (regulator of sigma subunit)